MKRRNDETLDHGETKRAKSKPGVVQKTRLQYIRSCILHDLRRTASMPTVLGNLIADYVESTSDGKEVFIPGAHPLSSSQLSCLLTQELGSHFDCLQSAWPDHLFLVRFAFAYNRTKVFQFLNGVSVRCCF